MELIRATVADLPDLLPMVRAYHVFEGISQTDAETESALRPLLDEGSAAGSVWLVRQDGKLAGYAALCYGHSIEFGGRDAFLDEFFLIDRFRGRGIGSAVLPLLKKRAIDLGIGALHLEVARGNTRAKALYVKAGFRARERFTLMSLDCRTSDGQAV